jgi:hypothetical protein
MKNLYLSFLILFALVMNIQEAKATTYTFFSFSAANWTTASKWIPSYPGTTIDLGDEVIINGICHMNIDVNIEGTLTVNIAIKVNSGNTLEIENSGVIINEGTVNVEGGGLTIDGILTNNNTLNLKSGGELRLENNPAQWPGGNFNWNDGGTLSIGADGELELPNPLTIASGRTLKVDGTLRNFGHNLTIGTNGSLIVNGSFILHNTATLVNNSSGLMTLNGLLKFKNNSTLTNNGAIDLNTGGELFYNANSSTMPGAVFNWNSGSVRIGGNGNLDVTGSYTIPLDGTLLINGIMELNGTITNFGDWTLNGGGNLILNNSSATWPDGNFVWETASTMTVGSSGTLTLTNTTKTIEEGRTLQVDGEFHMALTNNNPRQLDVDGTLINNGTTTHINGYNVNVGGVLNNNNVFTLKQGGAVSKLNITNGGLINNSGTLTNNRTFTVFSGGTFNNHGVFIMQNNGILGNTGAMYLRSGGEWNLNTNSAEWPDGNFIWETGSIMIIGEGGNLGLTGSKIIGIGNTLRVEGTLEIAGIPPFLDATLTNNGTIENNGTVTITSSDKLINHGTLTVNGILENNGTFTDTGLLNGNGTINSSSVYGATIAPGPNSIGPGCLSFNENFFNLGTLDFELADGNNCDDFDRIVVDGNATVKGTINISFIDDIEPSNNTVTILTATGTLTFDPEDITWPIDYEGTFSICSSCSPKELVVTFINSPLPVELIYFRAALTADNKVSLDWQTASEENNKGFEIQHSTNSRDWETIDFVNGNGTSTLLSTYNFQDQYAVEGYNYYRLKQIDFDGAYEYTEVRVVEFNQTAIDILVYPNPTTDELHIDLGKSLHTSTKNTTGRIQLFNSLGKALLEMDASSGDGSPLIHLKAYPKGIYSLLITIDQDVFTKQVILQ